MKKQLISTFILIIYSAILIKVMVFKEVPLIRVGSLMIYFGGSQTGPANLVPFKTILIYLLGEKGLIIGGINLIGNIVLLVPIGLLVPVVYRKSTWKVMLAVAIAFGFAIEGMQVVLRVGIFDIDDVILNGLGVLLGYWVFRLLAKKLSLMKSQNIITVVVILMVIAAGVASYSLIIYRNGHFPVSFEPGPQSDKIEHTNKEKGGMFQHQDPCGGTGGIGKIVSTGNYAFTIQLKDGRQEIIKLTSQTKIRNSEGTVLVSNLEIGNRVTIVTFESDQDGNKIATAVLICNASN